MATVEAGRTTLVDVMLEIGDVSEIVTVRGAVPLLRYDHHQLGGVIKREQIENLPLNGRNVLELAKLEPGVTSPVRGNANRTFIAALGAGLQTIPRVGLTRVTVDGVSINHFGTIGTALQISPEVVEQFEVSTANFDLGTSLTTNGVVNVVTRSGANEFRASGFAFHRDHILSAYPGLARDARNPDPFFQRQQFGSTGGGPVRRNRAFFFVSYEYTDQRGVVTVQPGEPALAPLGGIFRTPYTGSLFNARVDVQLSPRHTVVARHTLDNNSSFSGPGLPSGWSLEENRGVQTLAALKS